MDVQSGKRLNVTIFMSSSPVLSLVQVSLLNYVFLASWAFALPYSQYRPLASSVCIVWTCVIIVCKMLYQLKTIEPHKYNCTLVSITLTRSISISIVLSLHV